MQTIQIPHTKPILVNLTRSHNLIKRITKHKEERIHKKWIIPRTCWKWLPLLNFDTRNYYFWQTFTDIKWKLRSSFHKIIGECVTSIFFSMETMCLKTKMRFLLNSVCILYFSSFYFLFSPYQMWKISFFPQKTQPSHEGAEGDWTQCEEPHFK